MTVRRWMARVLLFLALGVASEAAAQTYRWVDEQGNPHYVGRRDQVPERYRYQLPGEKPGEPPRPRLPSSRPTGIATKVTGECTLRVRGTEQHQGLVVVLPELRSLLEGPRADARRAPIPRRMPATSVQKATSHRGRRTP